MGQNVEASLYLCIQVGLISLCQLAPLPFQVWRSILSRPGTMIAVIRIYERVVLGAPLF